MKNILTAALSATLLVCALGEAQAFTRHPSTVAERAQTKALNEQQLQLAKEENTGLAVNASGTTAAATMPVQQADAAATRPAGSDSTSGR